MNRPRNILLMDGVNPSCTEGISAFARTRGWCITLGTSYRHLTGWRGDGVLVSLQDDARAVRRELEGFAAARIPVVDLSMFRPDVRLPRVSGDNAAIGELAARHFADRGFVRAAWFSVDWSNVHRLRFEGFCRGLGRGPVDRWVWNVRGIRRRRNDWNALTDALAAKVSAAPAPLAVFAYNDADAAIARHACAAAGREVPESVAVLGVDDNPVICENQTVPLSSVRHDLTRVGAEAARLLEALMLGGPAPRHPLLLPPTGVVTRRSTDVIAAADPVLRVALERIRDNLPHSFGTAQLLDGLGVSRATLNRLFAANLGRTPGQEIVRQRLALVKLRLANTRDTLAEIAAATGFCSSSHLVSIFRGKVGMTPAEWRAAITSRGCR